MGTQISNTSSRLTRELSGWFTTRLGNMILSAKFETWLYHPIKLTINKLVFNIWTRFSLPAITQSVYQSLQHRSNHYFFQFFVKRNYLHVRWQNYEHLHLHLQFPSHSGHCPHWKRAMAIVEKPRPEFELLDLQTIAQTNKVANTFWFASINPSNCSVTGIFVSVYRHLWHIWGVAWPRTIRGTVSLQQDPAMDWP